MAHFESKFRETIIGVPTVKIQTNAAVDVARTDVCGWLIETIIGDHHTNLILTNEMIQC